jgi:DNA repair protein RecO (recombination protein O)
MTAMTPEKTAGLIIRLANFSESSQVVTFFTREHGKVAALAKGGKRLKSSFEAALDLLTACRIVFLRKSSASLDILTEAQLVSRFQPREKSLGSLYGGYYVAELLDGLTEAYDPHPNLYDEALATLSRLMKEDDPKPIIARFELLMLREIGHLPEFDRCIVCDQPPQADNEYSHWISQGGVICRDCAKPEYRQQQIQAGTLAVLIKLASESNEVATRLIPSTQQVNEIHRIALGSISSLLGRRPKMLRYLPF